MFERVAARPADAQSSSQSTAKSRFVLGPIDDPLEVEANRIADGANPALAGRPETRTVPLPGDRSGRLPESVHRLLDSPGQPLDVGTRNVFETRFKHDFSSVRVHADASAGESARSINALAYTAGDHIAFADGIPDVARADGRHTIAHELTHVVQNRTSNGIDGPTVVRRTEAQANAGASVPAKPESIIRTWLEQHQFAPPEDQPTEGERHVLLNGEEMTLSDAVKLAAAALQQPAQLVNSVIVAALTAPVASSSAALPFIGPKNVVPGINLAGPRDAFGIDPAIAKTVELSTIDDFLKAHGFKSPEVRDPTGDAVLFDGVQTTVEHVADRALALLGQYPTLKRADVLAHVRQKYVADRGGPGNQIVFGYTLVPKFGQYVSGPADPNNPLLTQHQFSFTITRQHHANDSPGFETSFQGSVTLTEHGILNVQAGGQEAIVKPLLHGWIQVSGLVQVMASENWSKSAAGTTVISPAIQAAAGGQILLTPTLRSGDYTFLNGHVQVGLQVLGGVQRSSSGTAGVANAGFVLNVPF